MIQLALEADEAHERFVENCLKIIELRKHAIEYDMEMDIAMEAFDEGFGSFHDAIDSKLSAQKKLEAYREVLPEKRKLYLYCNSQAAHLVLKFQGKGVLLILSAVSG